MLLNVVWYKSVLNSRITVVKTFWVFGGDAWAWQWPGA